MGKLGSILAALPENIGAWSGFGSSFGFLVLTYAEYLARGWPFDGGPLLPAETLWISVLAFGVLFESVRAICGFKRQIVILPDLDVDGVPADPAPGTLKPGPKAEPVVPPGEWKYPSTNWRKLYGYEPDSDPAPKPEPAPEHGRAPAPRIVPAPAVQSRDRAIDILARTDWAEARGELFIGRRAVAEVIANRVNKPKRFPETVEEVCLQPWQFSCWNQPGATVTMDNPTTADHSFCAMLEIAEMCIDGKMLSVLPEGTDHYYAPKGMVPPGSVPSWAEGQTPCATIGGHVFFNTIA